MKTSKPFPTTVTLYIGEKDICKALARMLRPGIAARVVHDKYNGFSIVYVPTGRYLPAKRLLRAVGIHLGRYA